MSASITDHDPEVFLQQAVWLRALATKLVRPEDAGDLVQETYVRFAAAPPDHLDSPRGWFARVARNLRGMTARSDQRRVQREAASIEPEPWPEPEELVVRAQRLRQLSEAVEALDEPLRATVLLHYFEGLSLAEIGRREGCPSSTVRGRLRTALSRLREDLDARYGGRRADWLSAFAPIVADGVSSTGAAAGTASVLAVSLGALALVAGCASLALVSVEPASAEPPTPAGNTAVAVSKDSTRTDSPRSVSSVETETPPTASRTKRFRTAEERKARLAAVHAARVARLEAEDMTREFIDEVTADEELFGIIESMMMMEDAARFVTACAEETPPQARGKLFAHVDFIGEPDVGTVIEAVRLDDDRSTPGMGEFATCVEESLFMLSLAPPVAGGTQTKTLFVDTTQNPVLTGAEIRPAAAAP